MSGFQNVVNVVQAPGVAGDFASTNPFSSVLTAAGGLVAPVGGLTVGNFFWVGPLGQTSQTYTSGWQIAFLGRNEQALITAFLGQYTMQVPQGFMVVGFTGGDFWAYVPNGATALGTVYADETTGAPQTAATNTVTGEVGFTGTASFATVSGTGQMTLATVTSGIVTAGDLIVGTGVTTGTSVVALVSGTANTVGAVYSMSATPTTESAEAVTTQSNVLNVTAVLTGGLSAGGVITGTNVTTGTSIASQLTGTAGGSGTYLLAIPGNAPFNTASETITGPANISSGWTFGPVTLAGAGVAKITHSVI